MQALARWLALCFFVQLVPATAVQAATFEDLLRKVPTGANVLMAVNVEQILKSDYAQAQGTAEKMSAAFERRAIVIPPKAAHFILASELDLERQRPVWEAAVMDTVEPPDFNQVAARLNSTVETISGAKAIGTHKAFVIDLGDQNYGLLMPSNRQSASRWIRQVKQGSNNLSEYLTKAGTYPDTAGTDIVLAVDLTDLLPQQFVAERLRSNETLKGRDIDLDKLAALATHIRGVRLGIKVGEKCHGRLVVDFSESPAALADFAKPLLLEAIGNAGMMLDELNEWKVAVGRTTVSLEGDLTDSGMREIAGFFAVPTDAVQAVSSEKTVAAPATSAQTSVAEASKKYYQEIEDQLDMLRRKHSQAKTFGQVGQWIANSARRIERMSTVDVDDQLADYGLQIAGQLRQITASLQGIGIHSAERESAIYGGESFYAGYGSFYYSGTDNQSARRQVRAEERAAGSIAARDIAQQIASDSANMRRAMSEKYKIPF